MFKNVFRKCRQNRGFTLMEVMVVVAILAVVVLIAVPSVIKMRQNMKFAERNDYAKSIYMAAQSNLTQMRSMGELGLLEQVPAAEQTAAVRAGANYRYTVPGTKAYDLVVPSSLDATVRNQQVIVEYHPKAGIVYAVYYHEGDETLTDLYSSIDLSKEENQREYEVGYYCVGSVDALEGEALQVSHTSASIAYDNGQKGIITVTIPMTDDKHNNIFAGTEGLNDPYGHYIAGLEVTLTINAENILTKNGAAVNDGTFQVSFKGSDTNHVGKFAKDITNYSIIVSIPLDSLASNGSFSNIPENKNTIVSSVGNAVFAGDNISVTADITYYPTATDPIVMIESATIAGINPIYHSLTPNPEYDVAKKDDLGYDEKPYILAVSNGRHLQNLSYLDAEFAQNIESIVFTQQAEDPVQPENGSTEGGTSEAQPANGAKTSTNTGSQENNTPTDLVLNWQDTVDAYSSTLTFHPIELRDFSYVPSILGNGVKIQNLTVSSAVDGNAGLFAALKNTSVEKITLENPIVNATGATSTGALIGKAENVAISDCDVITKNTGDTINYYISGQGDVGGLVGTATGTGSTNTISNCSSVAVVRSANGVQSNVGGLVGSSTDTDYTNCDSSATVRGGAYDDTTNYSYLGGLVGLAKNANFYSASSSASVKGTNALNDSGNYIPQKNYIGGLIGRAESCDFVSNVSANLTDLPAYAYGAGGLAGWIIGGEINANIGVALDCESSLSEVERFGGLAVYIENVDIETTGEAPIKIDIDGALSGNMVAGAVIGSTASTVENIEVSVDGSISGKDVTGFANTANKTIDKCRVILETKDAFIYGSNSAAGFINLNEANITNSYVYAKELQDDTGISVGKVDASDNGMASGFALTNKASIKQCMANVEVTKDSLFVRTNNATVKNCYGWLWGRSSEDAIKISSNCSYSYFVNGNTKQLAFYEGLGSNAASVLSSNILDTDALTDSWAVTLLNNGTDEEEADVWESGNNSYPYPRLVNLDHKGASAAPAEGQYPFGLIYEETYEGGDKGYIVTALEGDSLTTSTPPGLNNDKKIESTAFYLYHRTGSNLPGSAMTANPFDWLNVNQLYTVYKLNAGNHTVDQKTFNSFYPVDGNTYRIRTAEQFGYIDEHSGSTFRIEKSMEVSGTISSFSGTMTASSNVVIDASQLTQAMIGELKGSSEKEAKLSGLAVDGLKAPLVATVKSGGKIENCTLTKVNIPSGENVGAFAGTLEGGTISGGSAEGSVSGSNYVGGAIGYVKSGTVSNVTVNVGVSATGDKAGMFVGYAEGGSFTNCHSTAKSTGLPFGHFATVQLSSATHKSKYSVTDKILVSNFDNYSPVGDNIPETITIKVENCSFNNGQPALRSSEDYYYIVDTSKYQFEKGTPLSMTMVTADAKDITYKAVKSLCDESESSPVQTDYFIISGSAYYHVYASVSLVTDDASTDSEEKYTFTLTANNKSVFTKTITQKELGNKIPDDSNAPTFYKIGYYESDAYCRGGGYYLIHGGSSLGYLTYDSTEGIKWGGNADSESSLWIGDEKGGWKNYINESAIITIKAESIQEDGFLGLVSIKFENKDIDPYYSSEFFTCYVALYYGCSALGNTYEVNYPTT